MMSRKGREDPVYSTFKSHFKMRTPSPPRRHMDSRKPYNKRHSSPGYKRTRSNSISPPPKRRLSQRGRSRSRSPRPRRKSSPHRRRSRSRSRRRSHSDDSSRSPHRSRSPRRKMLHMGQERRSRSSSRGRYRPKPMNMDRPPDRDQNRPSYMSSGGDNNVSRNRGNRPDSSLDNSGPKALRGRDQSGSKQKGPASDSNFVPYRDNSGGRGDIDYRTIPPPQRRMNSPQRTERRMSSPQRRMNSPPRRMSSPQRRMNSPPQRRMNSPPQRRMNSPPRKPSPSPVQSAPRERFDQTGITMTDRFLNITGPLPPFSPTENITIGIERSITGDVIAVIPRLLSPAEVVVIRRKDEGGKPLCQRSEFITPKEDVVEKRTIKMAPEEPKHKQRISIGPSRVRPMLTERWTLEEKDDGPGLSSSKKSDMSREEMDNYLLNASAPSSSSSRHGDRDDRYKSHDSSRSHSNRGLDRDERVVLEKEVKHKNPVDSFKFTVNISSPDQDLRVTKDRTRFEYDPNDLRHNLSKKKPRDPTPDKDDAFDARQKLLKKRESELKKREALLKKRAAELEKKEKGSSHSKKPKEELPDFSNRPGKYEDPDWKDNPESIPKGSYYFEHDNRDGWRGRGRGFRGRGFRGSSFEGRGGSYRGAYRGSYNKPQYDGGLRGAYKPSYKTFPGRSSDRKALSPTRTWVHDKFQDDNAKHGNDDKEEKPSSTTKN